MRTPLVAGNWKMNTTRGTAAALAKDVASGLPADLRGVGVLVCPPFPYLDAVQAVVETTPIALGAQNCYFEPPGAFTGEVSTDMLADLGCTSVILGHSERRHVLGETDEIIAKKVRAALAAGLQVILCVGELLEEREAARTEAVLDAQLAGGLAPVEAASLPKLVIAYEPVWAIGTGKTATPDQADAAHAHIRARVAERYDANAADALRILYGGSVKPANAAELIAQPHVDGALVGGASLKAEMFLPIVTAAVDHARSS